MEIEAYFDTVKDCFIVVLWKDDTVLEKQHLASLEEVDASVNLLRRLYPLATVIYGV